MASLTMTVGHGLESHRLGVHQVLKNASDLLQNTVLQCNATEDVGETMKVISSSLVTIISSLSQELIQFGQLAKEIVSKEAKFVSCIRSLRSCVEKQNLEIAQLKSAANTLTKSMATDTYDLERLEDAKMQYMEKEVLKYKQKTLETLEKCERAVADHQRLKKALNKSILMLRTQQALLESYDRDEDEPFSHPTKSKRPAVPRQQSQTDMPYHELWKRNVNENDVDSFQVVSTSSPPPDRRAVRYFPQQADESVQTSHESLPDTSLIEKSDSSPVKDGINVTDDDITSPIPQQNTSHDNKYMLSRQSNDCENNREQVRNSSFVSDTETSHHSSAGELTISQSQLNVSIITVDSQDSFAAIMGCYDQYYFQNAGTGNEVMQTGDDET